jgi:hypothetical protein
VVTIHRQDVSAKDSDLAVALKRDALVAHITQLQKDNHWVEKNARDLIGDPKGGGGMKTGWHVFHYHRGGPEVLEDHRVSQNLHDVAGFL